VTAEREQPDFLKDLLGCGLKLGVGIKTDNQNPKLNRPRPKPKRPTKNLV
jgi:hypothetical protein